MATVDGLIQQDRTRDGKDRENDDWHANSKELGSDFAEILIVDVGKAPAGDRGSGTAEEDGSRERGHEGIDAADRANNGVDGAESHPGDNSGGDSDLGVRCVRYLRREKCRQYVDGSGGKIEGAAHDDQSASARQEPDRDGLVENVAKILGRQEHRRCQRKKDKEGEKEAEDGVVFEQVDSASCTCTRARGSPENPPEWHADCFFGVHPCPSCVVPNAAARTRSSVASSLLKVAVSRPRRMTTTESARPRTSSSSLDTRMTAPPERTNAWIRS